MGQYFDEARRGWRFNFQFRGQRYQSPRAWGTKSEAAEAEAVERRRVKRIAAGLDDETRAADVPALSFTAWAGIYFDWVQRQHRDGHLKDPVTIGAKLSSILRFWGEPPTDPAARVAGAPYHNLTLIDPLRDPAWLRRFEDWIDSTGVARGTKRHYLVYTQRLYSFALKGPEEYRAMVPMVTRNPFAGRPKPKGRRRRVTLTAEQLQAWTLACSYHTRLALSIAALAPKLRLQNILKLQWKKHVRDDDGIIVVDDHKTDADGLPLVTPITLPLRIILDDARRRHPHATHVIWYRGGPIKTIDEGLKRAAFEAGIPYGMKSRDADGDENGATFHTLRHSMATELARMGLEAAMHAQAMGHRSAQTTKIYTHLNVDDQRAPLEQLGERLNIVGTVTAKRMRAERARSKVKALPPAHVGLMRRPPKRTAGAA